MQVRSLGYVGVESPEAKRWEEFGPDLLGMQSVDGDAPGAVYLRWDDRHHRLAVHPGERDRLRYLGWELCNDDDLADAVDEIRALGVEVQEGTDEECEERRVRRMVGFDDPAGIRHEIFYGQLSLPGQFRPGRAISGFVTGEQGLGHAVLAVPDLAAAEKFYKGVLGFKKSDEIYTFIDLSFFHCNPRHHTLAITEIPRVRGLHHIMVQVESLDDVGVAYDLCMANDVPMTMTLGRHPNDRMVSFYVRTPSGFEIEYGWGAIEVDDATWTVTQYDRPSIWGHKMVGTTPPACLEPVD